MSGTPSYSLRTIFLAFLAALAICVPPALSASEPSGAERRYIVVLEESVDRLGAVARAQTEQRDSTLGFVYGAALNGYSATMTEAAAEDLRRDPRVRSVELDHVRALAAQPNPTGIVRTFASANKNIDIDEVDDVKVNVGVAVIDNGVEPSHPDLNVVDWTDCSNGTEKEAKCEDGKGTANDHGTHVAGTVAALDNSEGVVGVAPGARILSVKTLGTGVNWESEEIAGINWVTSKASEIEVANMSIECGGLPCKATEAWKKAISKSVEKGIVYVVAAGNNSGDAKESVYGTHPDVITVSAITDFDGIPNQEAEPNACRGEFEAKYGPRFDDTLAAFSNFGQDIEIAAPGTCIRSTVTGKTYAEAGWWGTSMAAPHVAGAAAILTSMSNPQNKGDVETIREELIKEGNEGWEDTSGDGVQEKLLDVSNETAFNP